MDASDPVPQIIPCATILKFADCEARIRDHLRKFGLTGELANGFNQILVGLPVARQDRSEHRNYGERVLVVHPECLVSLLDMVGVIQ